MSKIHIVWKMVGEKYRRGDKGVEILNKAIGKDFTEQVTLEERSERCTGINHLKELRERTGEDKMQRL